MFIDILVKTGKTWTWVLVERSRKPKVGDIIQIRSNQIQNVSPESAYDLGRLVGVKLRVTKVKDSKPLPGITLTEIRVRKA